MVRAPCCEKMGLKKGPWTSEEDHILINYIQLYGHGNWRALPKQAGLLRCGKSCRLRWTNYLRPDIKRGNFSRDEEDVIINLHQMLGNRWSAIAARLPGRTDNEIKNVWHTHLKKRVRNDQITLETESALTKNSTSKSKSENDNISNVVKTEESTIFQNDHCSLDVKPLSPPQSSTSDVSSVTITDKDGSNVYDNNGDDQSKDTMDVVDFTGSSDEMDENFWLEVLYYADNSSDFDTPDHDHQLQFPFTIESSDDFSTMHHEDSMEFWRQQEIYRLDLHETL